MRLLLAACLLLSSCASLRDSGPVRCHGPRWPANPYGSVLVTRPDQIAPPPASPAPAAGCGARP